MRLTYARLIRTRTPSVGLASAVMTCARFVCVVLSRAKLICPCLTCGLPVRARQTFARLIGAEPTRALARVRTVSSTTVAQG